MAINSYASKPYIINKDTMACLGQNIGTTDRSRSNAARGIASTSRHHGQCASMISVVAAGYSDKQFRSLSLQNLSLIMKKM